MNASKHLLDILIDNDASKTFQEKYDKYIILPAIYETGTNEYDFK